MPLPQAAERTELHRRTITLRGFRRSDGLFDVEGHLHDVKAVDFFVAGMPRPAGTDIHSMWLRMTFDASLTIVDAAAWTEAMPYEGFCNTIEPKYRELIGMAIRPGFSAKVRDRFGGVAGCTHLTELIGAMATAAFQTVAGQGLQDPDRKPYQLDGCHALKTDQPAVARFYPRWYRAGSESA